MTARLAVCASRREISCALQLADGELRRSASRASRGSDLVASVETMLGDAGLHARDLEEVRIDVGPGSYTGLRIAVTLARFAARFGGAAVRTASSFELIAARLRREQGARRVQVLLDARRDRVYHATLDCDGDSIVVEGAFRAIELDAFDVPFTTDDHVVRDTTLAERFDADIESAGAHRAEVPDYDAADLFDAAVPLSEPAIEELQPLYLMASYAE